MPSNGISSLEIGLSSHSKRRKCSGRKKNLQGKLSSFIKRYTKCVVLKGQVRNGNVVFSKEPRNSPGDVTDGPLSLGDSESLARIRSEELVGTLVRNESLKKEREK